MRAAVTAPDVHVSDAPYSGALREGNVLFVAGTVAVDENGALVGEGDLAAQTRQVLLNIQRLLAAAGAGYEHVVRMTYFVTDISRWAETAPVRREFLREPFPAATAVEVDQPLGADETGDRRDPALVGAHLTQRARLGRRALRGSAAPRVRRPDVADVHGRARGLPCLALTTSPCRR